MNEDGEPPVLIEEQGAILHITLNRPGARNALTPEMLCRLADAFILLAESRTLRVATLTGQGDKAFCSGGDLASTIPLLTGARTPVDEWDRRLLTDPRILAASGLRDFPLHKPVVAAINGACMAAGFELMLGTDIRLATSEALFALPEVKRGVVPFAGSMARLPRQIGRAHAMEIMLTGDAIDAVTALRMGLINRIVAFDQLAGAARSIAERIASNAPCAVQELKRTVVAVDGLPLDDAYRLEDQCRARVLATEDAREGPRAFIEKRLPRFVGR